MEFKDYYATLGLSKTASEAEIKRAYRKLARKHHPDLNQGDTSAEARFKELNEAHEVLSDPEKRKKYDELGANWRTYEQAERPGAAGSPGAGRGGRGPGGGNYRTVTPEEMRDLFGGAGAGAGTGDPFSDFFQTFFGGQQAGRAAGKRSASRRGADLESTVDLTLEEVFAGASRRVMTERDGQPKTVDVRIPAGVKDGSRVRVAGEGEAGAGGGAPGDLFLIAHVLPHPRFERDGADLRVRVHVPVTTAVLGGEVSVPTIAGTVVRIKVPELTRPGRILRLRGEGMPAVGHRDQRGDLYATVDVDVPDRLSDEARTHWEALRSLDPGADHAS